MVWAFFDRLGGHHSLQTAAEVKFGLRFEISDLQNLNDRSFKVPLLVSLGTCQEILSLHDLSCAGAAGNNGNAVARKSFFGGGTKVRLG